MAQIATAGRLCHVFFSLSLALDSAKGFDMCNFPLLGSQKWLDG
jgi:hypothetical protein